MILEEYFFSYKDIKEVGIFPDGYTVIIEVPWTDVRLGYEKHNIFDENPWANLSDEWEITPVEMHYHEVKLPLLLAILK